MELPVQWQALALSRNILPLGKGVHITVTLKIDKPAKWLKFSQ
jgi:hypothetical protein